MAEQIKLYATVEHKDYDLNFTVIKISRKKGEAVIQSGSLERTCKIEDLQPSNTKTKPCQL